MTLLVENQPDRSRYALIVDGETIGLAEYELTQETIDFVHTEIDEAKREHGMASQLVRAALDDVRERSTRRVIATCPYVIRWLDEHPEYQDLQRRTA